jgi:hypothetical protein
VEDKGWLWSYSSVVADHESQYKDKSSDPATDPSVDVAGAYCHVGRWRSMAVLEDYFS